LTIRDGDRPLPLQRRVLTRWPDESVKWLIVHLQPNLPGNADYALRFEIAEGPVQSPASETTVVLAETSDGIHIDTGPLSFRVPRRGFLPLIDVHLNDRPLWPESPFAGFALSCGQRELDSSDGEVKLRVEEAGPLRAVVLVRGRHRTEDGEGFLDLHGRITAYAGKPYVEVEHAFYHCEDAGPLELGAIQLAVDLPAEDGPDLALGEGYYRTRVESSREPLELALTTDTILYQANEHYVDSFYGDFWADWRAQDTGLAVSIYQAHQNFPKRLRVAPDGIEVGLYPDDAAPATIYQGMGKAHRLLLHFHDGHKPLEAISARSLQFQLPDRPALLPQWYQEHNAWEFDVFPERVPGQVMTRLIHTHDGRPKGLGMLHFGDAPDAAYTDQGRGSGSTVWVNNEYDRAHACTLFYALTGERRMFDSALVTARHWLDIDLCRHSSDPLRHGGLVIHSAHHVTGNVTPSHEWVEGFLDYFHLTGRKEGLDAAHMVADNLLRHLERPHMQDPGATQAREGGWALRAMVAMYQETGEARFKDTADRLAGLFLDWQEEYGGLLAPYTSHSMPRVPFMISIALNSLARYLLIEEDQLIKMLIIQTADDMLEHCLGPDGVLYYKELPSLRRPAPTVHAVEALTHAYRLSGERRFLEAARRQFVAYFSRPASYRAVGAKRADEDGAVIQGSGGGREFAASYTSLITFISAAVRAGLLTEYDYPQ
jgi:hypothetical protein